MYVGDIIDGCKEISTVLVIKRQLCGEIDVTDRGSLNNFLGIEIEQCDVMKLEALNESDGVY